MELKELIISLTKTILEEELRTSDKAVLPFVCGIKDGAVVATSPLNIKFFDSRFASLVAGYTMSSFKCDAIYYMCHSYMRHCTEQECSFVLKNFSTESPEFYPDSQRTLSRIFGVVDIQQGGVVTSFAINKRLNIPENKTWSIGTYENIYPKLIAIGYGLKSTAGVMAAFEGIGSKDTSDLAIIDRGNTLERQVFCESNRR